MITGDIRLIQKKHELRGTQYFEFYPGANKGNECWSKKSVYLTEEVFGLIEPIFESRERSFSHYTFVNIDRATWAAIIADLTALAERARLADTPEELRDWIGFILKTSAEDFRRNFRENAEALSVMITNLTDWLGEQLEQHDTIAILGI